jgi:hypothetical protein
MPGGRGAASPDRGKKQAPISAPDDVLISAGPWLGTARIIIPL